MTRYKIDLYGPGEPLYDTAKTMTDFGALVRNDIAGFKQAAPEYYEIILRHGGITSAVYSQQFQFWYLRIDYPDGRHRYMVLRPASDIACLIHNVIELFKRQRRDRKRYGKLGHHRRDRRGV